MKRMSAPPSSMWVAQEVAASGAAEVGMFDELAHFATEDVGIKTFAVAGEAEGFFVLAEGHFGP